jgi:hypothetical protein
MKKLLLIVGLALPWTAFAANGKLYDGFTDTEFAVSAFGRELIIYDQNHTQVCLGNPTGTTGGAVNWTCWDLHDLRGNRIGSVTDSNFIQQLPAWAMGAS